MRVEEGAGLVEGKCERWEEENQAKTSPLQVGERIFRAMMGWGSLIQVPAYKGGWG